MLIDITLCAFDFVTYILLGFLEKGSSEGGARGLLESGDKLSLFRLLYKTINKLYTSQYHSK